MLRMLIVFGLLASVSWGQPPGEDADKIETVAARVARLRLRHYGKPTYRGELMKLIEALEDDDDVQNVYANFEISDEVMAKLAEA